MEIPSFLRNHLQSGRRDTYCLSLVLNLGLPAVVKGHKKSVYSVCLLFCPLVTHFSRNWFIMFFPGVPSLHKKSPIENLLQRLSGEGRGSGINVTMTFFGKNGCVWPFQACFFY